MKLLFWMATIAAASTAFANPTPDSVIWNRFDAHEAEIRINNNLQGVVNNPELNRALMARMTANLTQEFAPILLAPRVSTGLLIRVAHVFVRSGDSFLIMLNSGSSFRNRATVEIFLRKLVATRSRGVILLEGASDQEPGLNWREIAELSRVGGTLSDGTVLLPGQVTVILGNPTHELTGVSLERIEIAPENIQARWAAVGFESIGATARATAGPQGLHRLLEQLTAPFGSGEVQLLGRPHPDDACDFYLGGRIDLGGRRAYH